LVSAVDDFTQCLRSDASRAIDLTWKPYVGRFHPGHFAAMEQPDALAKEIKEFFRELQ